jgi:hypothetical protein
LRGACEAGNDTGWVRAEPAGVACGEVSRAALTVTVTAEIRSASEITVNRRVRWASASGISRGSQDLGRGGAGGAGGRARRGGGGALAATSGGSHGLEGWPAGAGSGTSARGSQRAARASISSAARLRPDTQCEFVLDRCSPARRTRRPVLGSRAVRRCSSHTYRRRHGGSLSIWTPM